ncbi:MAG: hypothetical protein ACTHJT_09790, partial [Cytophaga sp.]|uniref:hypothetical protein n=1 Tax=Cytophaga sp. TaxID=29535 RepID=UPI003F7FD3A0
MNAPDNLYERIDAYLNGHLSEKDKQAFEADMEADASFSKEVELQKLIHQLILEKGLSDIRKQVGKDITVKKQLPWGEINFIVFSILFTGLLCYLWVDPFKKDKAVSKIPDVTATRTVEQTKSIQEAKTDSPKQKEKDFRVSEIPAVHDTTALITSASSQVQRPVHGKDTSVVVVHQVSDPQQANEKNTKKEDATVPCPEILFSVHTEASCRNGNTGSVQLLLSGVYGGQPPYRYTIDGESS